MNKIITTLVAVIIAMQGLIVGTAWAGGSTYPYEVTACWQMDNPDLVAGTYEFPQTYHGVDCSDAPTEACDAAEYQFDKYWIRDNKDAALLDDLKANGLTLVNGHPADGPLEPHGAYGLVVTSNPDLCVTPTPARAWFRTVAYCITVRVEGRHNVVSIDRKRLSAHRLAFTAHAAKGAVFKNGETTVRRVVHTKRTGCGNGSS